MGVLGLLAALSVAVCLSPGPALTGFTWGAATILNTDPANANDARVAMNAAGDGAAVWVQWGIPFPDVYASVFTPGGGWSGPVMIGSPVGGNVYEPDIGLDAAGNVVVVWAQDHNGEPNPAILDVWANRYKAGVGWGIPEQLEGGIAGWPRVTVNDAGDAIAIWSRGPDGDLWARRYVGTGWSPAVQVVDGPPWPHVGGIASDPVGNAIVTWTTFDGVRYNLWASHFSPSTGWGIPVSIEDDDSVYPTSLSPPLLAMDATGRALAVWGIWKDMSTFTPWANAFSPSTGWGSATVIGPTTEGNGTALDLAMVPSGDAIGLWGWSDVGLYRLLAIHYTPGSGWGIPVPIDGGHEFNEPRVAMGGDGSAVAVWSDGDALATRYDPAAGWSVVEIIDVSPHYVPRVRVAMDGVGNALALWEQFNGAFFDVWANYGVNTPSPPSPFGSRAVPPRPGPVRFRL